MDVNQISRGRKLAGLLKNMGWMTISNFASKILVFLMVPFYTHYLSAEGYGIYDLGYTAVILLAPLATGNIGEAIMRFAIVKEDKIGEYFATASFASLLVAFIVVLICTSGAMFFGMNAELCAVGYMLVANIFYILMSMFSRGIGHVREMAYGGLINSVLLVTFSMVLVTVFKLDVLGCLIATSTAVLLAAVYMAVSCKVWIYVEKPSMNCFRELVGYGMPLSVNTLGWWVNSSFCRYAVAALMGVSGAGILAAAYKIPSIPKAIQQIFIQAWQLSAIESFDPKDSDGFFKKIYTVACCMSCLLCSCVIAITPVLATLMFSNKFYDAWIYVPILMLCLVFDCLGSVVGGVFSAVGNTRPIAASATVSVVLTVIACLILIPIIGLWGAAISSLISSISIWLCRTYWAKPYISSKIRWRSLLLILIILTVQALLAILVPVGILWGCLQGVCVIALAIHTVRKVGFKSLIASVKKKR